MKLKKKISDLAKKYKHAWVFIYIFVYMPWFLFLEKHVTTRYHVIQTGVDEHIPFIEYFIIPYLRHFFTFSLRMCPGFIKWRNLCSQE